MQTLVEFKFTDFYVEPYSFMNVINALVNHPTLGSLELYRNEISEDLATAIIQTLYYNSSLKKINLDGNPISIALYKQNVIKPYFSGRKDLKIIIA